VEQHVNARQIVSIALVATLWLTSSVVTLAQSNWPTAKKAATVQKSPPETHRKPAKSVATPLTPRRGKRASTSTSPAATPDQITLRAMSEIIGRQTLAIEALAVRLEAAERRLETVVSSAHEPSNDDACDTNALNFVYWRTFPSALVSLETQDPDHSAALVAASPRCDPFRPNRAVDWAQVVEELAR
jgi:hypothetical protein